MAEEKDPIVAKFTPQFDGAFLRGAPPRDLTQRDVDQLDPLVKRHAFAPHPGFGTPLYTIVDEGRDKTVQVKAVAAADKAAEKDGNA